MEVASVPPERFYEFASDAVEIAWYAGTDRGVPAESDLHDAAEFFAYAIAERWMAFLQVLIIAVLKKAGKVAGKIAGTAAEKLELKAHVGEVVSIAQLRLTRRCPAVQPLLYRRNGPSVSVYSKPCTGPNSVQRRLLAR